MRENGSYPMVILWLSYGEISLRLRCGYVAVKLGYYGDVVGGVFFFLLD